MSDIGNGWSNVIGIIAASVCFVFKLNARSDRYLKLADLGNYLCKFRSLRVVRVLRYAYTG